MGENTFDTNGKVMLCWKKDTRGSQCLVDGDRGDAITALAALLQRLMAMDLEPDDGASMTNIQGFIHKMFSPEALRDQAKSLAATSENREPTANALDEEDLAEAHVDAASVMQSLFPEAGTPPCAP